MKRKNVWNCSEGISFYYGSNNTKDQKENTIELLAFSDVGNVGTAASLTLLKCIQMPIHYFYSLLNL